MILDRADMMNEYYILIMFQNKAANRTKNNAVTRVLNSKRNYILCEQFNAGMLPGMYLRYFIMYILYRYLIMIRILICKIYIDNRKQNLQKTNRHYVPISLPSARPP